MRSNWLATKLGAHAWLDKDDNYAQFGDVYNRLGKFFNKASEGVAA